LLSIETDNLPCNVRGARKNGVIFEGGMDICTQM